MDGIRGRLLSQRWIIFAVVAAVSAVVAPASTPARDRMAMAGAGESHRVDFEVASPDPADRNRETGSRQVGPAMGFALEEPGNAVTSDRRRWAIDDSLSLKNLAVTLRVKAAPGRSEQDGAIAVRMASRDAYYMVRLDARRDRVAFCLVDHGRSSEIAGVDSEIASERWHTLELRAEDDRFTVSLDGSWLFTAYDRTLAGPGRVAVWSTAEGVRFDRIEILPLPAAP